jgi:hypothetical protein
LVPRPVLLEASADKAYRGSVHNFFKRKELEELITTTLSAPSPPEKEAGLLGTGRAPAAIRISFCDRVGAHALALRVALS